MNKSSNGVIRRISTRLDSNDYILAHLNHTIDLESQVQLCDRINSCRQDVKDTAEYLEVDGGESILRRKKKKLTELHQQLLKTLNMLSERQKVEDQGQLRAQEWRQGIGPP